MRSAIFQDPGVRRPKKAPFKRVHAQSPRIPPPQPPLKWHLDDMVAAYTSSGALPPVLSPTLPPRFGAADAKHATPPAPELDAVPPLLLSPTLPGVFSGLAHPAPKKAEPARKLGDLPDLPHVPRVRWALRQADKPRLVLRISFRNVARFQDALRGRRSPHKPRAAGLPEPPKNPWRKTAKDLHAQFASCSRSDPLFAFVLQLDWLLCSAMACDLDGAGADAAANWLHLHSQTPVFVHQLERFVKNCGFSDKKKSYLSFLVAVLAAVKAMLLKRVNSLWAADLESDAADMIAVQRSMIDNYRRMEDHFAESQSFFTNSPNPASIYPRAWQNRASSMVKPAGSPMAPAADKYFLPLGPYSDLKEACAYLSSCLKEFTEVFAADMNGGARYTLQSERKQ